MRRENDGRSDHGGRIGVLSVDPELGAGLSAEEFGDATRRCNADVVWLARGAITGWRPGGDGDHDLACVLVVRGLVSRRVRADDGRAVELFGPGDLLHPWAPDDEMAVRAETRWRVLDSATLALLDRRFFASTSRWPALHSALLERSARCSQSLLVRLAIAEISRVTQRVHLVLWHLADRWGSVEPAGVVLALRLPRTVLAELVCARRESVSRALSTLAADDLVLPHPRGYLLRGQAPAQSSPTRLEPHPSRGSKRDLCHTSPSGV